MKKYRIMMIAFVFVLATLISIMPVSAVSISEVDPDNEYKYEEIILRKTFSTSELEDPYFDVYYYSEGYEYYSPDNSATVDEAIPDYVLIYLSAGSIGPMPAAKVFGNYVLHQMETESPFRFGIGVYIPKSNKVYDLVKAYEMDIEGIEKVFTEAGVGSLIGDMDKDRKLTVKDATYIQKCLTGIIEFDSDDCIEYFAFSDNPPLKYISDFNRDRVRNIKDATAIQKHIAGLEY